MGRSAPLGKIAHARVQLRRRNMSHERQPRNIDAQFYKPRWRPAAVASAVGMKESVLWFK